MLVECLLAARGLAEPVEVGYIILMVIRNSVWFALVLQIWQLRLREVKHLVLNHVVNK